MQAGTSNKRVLIVYYSSSGNTKKVLEALAKRRDADRWADWFEGYDS